MANEGTDNKPILESFNQAIDLNKSFNSAVSLAQTITQEQATNAGTSNASAVQANNQSSGKE